MTWPIRQKWFWMLFVMLLAMIIIPFLVIGILIRFSPSSIVVTLIAVIVVWVIVKSYMDWSSQKKNGVREGEET